MNRQETIKIIVGLKTMFPNSYNNMNAEEKEVLVSMWQDTLQDYTYNQVYQAMKMYITSNTSGFAPTPANIIENIRTMQPSKYLSENQAWDVYYKGICNSSYNSVEEYNKLPEEIKKITSPQQMRSLAQEGNEGMMASVKASFNRDYQKVIEETKKIETLPFKEQTEIKAVLTTNTNNNLQLENKGE